MSKKIIAWVKNSDSITIVFEDRTRENISTENSHFADIMTCLRNANYDKIHEYVNLADQIKAKNATSKSFAKERISIKNGNVYYITKNDVAEVLHGTLIEKIISDLHKGYNVEALVSFLDNLMDNPLDSTKQELYDFLESGNITITQDGCFLAYKRVLANYLDVYSKTISNAPGNIVSIERNEVDTDRNRTCSYGLHFCSLDYLKSYGSDGSGYKTVIVKVNPADVVAIPTDYNFTKGRTCKYEVVGEYEGCDTEEAFTENFISEETKSSVGKKVKWVDNTKPVDKYALEKSLLNMNDKLVVYRLNTGDKPKLVKYDLNGKSRDALTGRFLPNSAKVSEITLKSYKDAIRD